MRVVPISSIDLITGDTDRVSLGGGSHSGRSMRHAATLFAIAAPELIGKGKAVAAQGVGEAMWEECAIDPASGQPLCGSFMDYGMPRSDNLPSFATEIVEMLSPTNPFGIKAGGEGGCTPALAVVVSAILGALAPLGVRDITMPATPFKVWRAIRGAQDKRINGRSLGNGQTLRQTAQHPAIAPP